MDDRKLTEMLFARSEQAIEALSDRTASFHRHRKSALSIFQTAPVF